MIHFFAKNQVSSNTSTTEQVEIMYLSKGREDAKLVGGNPPPDRLCGNDEDFERYYEKRLLARIETLTIANQNLIRDRVLLNRHNQALHNCWTEALENKAKQYQDLRAAVDEILILREEVRMLQNHLNPKEKAA